MIKFTQGDDVTLTLTAVNGDGSTMSLTGATLTTYFPKGNGQQVTISNDAHTPANQTTYPGRYTVELTASETAQVKAAADLNIMTKVVINGQTTHVHGKGILEVLKATTL